jgi:hypothetical protein
MGVKLAEQRVRAAAGHGFSCFNNAGTPRVGAASFRQRTGEPFFTLFSLNDHLGETLAGTAPP